METLQILINWGSVIAFLIVSLGTILQIIKTFKMKSVGDIALSEVSLRVIATIMIFAKIVSTGDFYLISGQSIFTVTLLFYLILVLNYRN